ncbi:7724_t:CDS:2 [Acaulospora colombiana]|uniref:7724_t:CDS:1 n=1 Tax=Acaulospora colombiana TaxID=27376 RepID=A0ACA9KEI3_9GLOM|nr:7724_t:CDS:2 [Acaulospora colombiana]
MTTSLTSNSAPSRKSSKKSKAGPTVRLPKPSVFTEGLRERCETTVLKTTDEEVNVKTPETSTKPDIFQTPPFLHDDKIIVVRCPPLSKKQEEKDKDAHISDALDALNGTRREALVTPETNRSSNIPITAIEALEKLFGKVPDQKIRGSNYGRLAQDFTFPPKNQSANGSSNAGSSVASSSKNGSESKEDPEEIEKKRRRKSNLNALAKEFTPSSIPGSASTTESDKPTDVLESKEDESKKKRNARKEKV